MAVLIGIDAGGTKTVGLVADEEGNVLREVAGNGANLQTHGELAVEKVLDDVIERLAPSGAVGAICLGMAGVDRPRDEGTVRGILKRLGFKERVRIVNDAVIALVAGSLDRTGIVVVAGTGAMAYGVDGTGSEARSSGLGQLLADEGSGGWLGSEAVRAAVRSADGRAPRSSLEAAVFEALRVASLQDLVPRAYEEGVSWAEMGHLAGLVEAAAHEGDRAAVDIIERAAGELRLAAGAVARRLDFRAAPPTLVLSGGAFRACPSLGALIAEDPGFPVRDTIMLDRSPAHGALILALDLLKS